MKHKLFIYLSLLALTVSPVKAAFCSEVFSSGLVADTQVKFDWNAYLTDETDLTLETTSISVSQWQSNKSCDTDWCVVGSQSRTQANSITFPDVDNASDVTISGTTVLAPGTYRDVTIQSNKSLQLSAGDYYFRSLTTNSKSDLVATGATVRIFVRDGITFGSSSLNNCTKSGNTFTPGTVSDLVFYSADTITTGDSMCISAFVYSVGNFGTAKIQTGRGSLSGANVELGSSSVFTTDLTADITAIDFGALCDQPAQTPPIMNDVPDQHARINRAFTLELSLYAQRTNDDPITSYTLTGTLPAGMSFNSTTGLLSGTPTAYGDYNLSAYATDDDGDSNITSFTLTVADTAIVLDMRMDECSWDENVAGTVKDSSGNSIDGNISNGINTGSYGIVNRKGVFNQPGIITTQNDPKLTLEEVTSTVWIYPEEMPASNGKLKSILSKDVNYEYHIINDSGTFRIYWWWRTTTGNTYHYNSDGTLALNKWYFVAIRYVDGEQHLIVKSLDGTVDSDTVRNYTGTLRPDSSNGIEIGGDRNIAERIFNGKIDEAKVFDGALAVTTIDAIYQNEKSGLNYDGATRAPVDCNTTITLPLAEYRLDACYWQGNGATDVLDNSANALNGEALNGTQSTSAESVLCNSADLLGTGSNKQIVVADNPKLDAFGNQITVMAWLYPNSYSSSDAIAVAKNSDSGYNDGWGLISKNSNTVTFYVNSYWNSRADATVNTGTWTHVAGVYDGASVDIYINGVKYVGDALSDALSNSTQALMIGYSSNISQSEWDGYIDEVKLYDAALDADEIKRIYNYERGGFNSDGSERNCQTCDATVDAHTWNLVGIPADLRSVAAANREVADIFDEFPSASYGSTAASDRWIVYKRTYSDTNNSSDYAVVPYTGEALEFGIGYWLGSASQAVWNASDQPNVDYNSTSSACTAGRCVEIPLTPITHNFAVDGDDGTGPYRYNMSGFVGKAPVEWGNCRILADSAAYTPSELEDSGIGGKQIWIYNPTSNSYDTCDDTTPGGCLLNPYYGMWIQLDGPSKGLNMRVLIPND